MSFLTPLFLLGALAVAGPVVFHLIRRTTRDRKPFSTLLFLDPTPPRLTRKSRIEHWLLLLLRCLALVLLALGFARPFLPRLPALQAENDTSKRLVVLLDTSASMQRSGAWKSATDRVLEVVEKSANVRELALVTFDQHPSTLLSFADWKSLPAGERTAVVRDRLQKLKPSWRNTQLATALTSAAESASESTAGTQAQVRQVVLVSDLQEGGHLDALQSYEWPKGVQLVVEDLKIRPAGNANLQLLTEEAGSTIAGTNGVRVRIRNSADARKDQFEVGWARTDGLGFVGIPIKVDVPAGQARTITLPSQAKEPLSRIQLTGDEAEFDNTVYLTPSEVGRVRLLYVGKENSTDAHQPLFFLQQAWPTDGSPGVDWTVRAPADVTSQDLPGPRLMVVTQDLPSAAASSVKAAINAGATCLLLVRQPGKLGTLSELVGVPDLAATEVSVTGFSLWGDIDFRHPLFAGLADPRFSDFTKIRFWKHRRVELGQVPQVQVIARFDSGEPALVEIPVGQGRVFVLTSGWHPEDSQLALSTKFVPFLQSLLEYSGAIPKSLTQQHYVGEPLALGPIEEARSIEFPDGSRQELPRGATNAVLTTVPGLYHLTSAKSRSAIAVNLDPSEGRTTPTGRDELERFGIPLQAAEVPAAIAGERRQQAAAAEAEGQQKLWRWFLATTALVLFLETLAGGWFTRRETTAQEATV